MRRNGVLLTQEKAERARAVRAEIGRLLREQYEADVRPMSDRLADLIKNIEQCESQPEPASGRDRR